MRDWIATVRLLRSPVPVLAAGLVVLSGCGTVGVPVEVGIKVDFVNANAGGVAILDSPSGRAGLPGCPVHQCSPGPMDASGAFVGWTETRPLPHTYQVLLHGSPVRCPPATGPDPGLRSDYAVVYQITVGGRCVIAQNSPLD